MDREPDGSRNFNLTCYLEDSLDRYQIRAQNVREISIIPQDIWIHIIRYLECYGKSFCNLALACSQFYKLTKESVLIGPILRLYIYERVKYKRTFIKRLICDYSGQWKPEYLLMACEKGRYKLVKMLLYMFRYSRILLISQYTINDGFIVACSLGYMNIVNHLIRESYVDPAIYDNKAVKIAIKMGHAELIGTLLLNDGVINSITSEELLANLPPDSFTYCSPVITKFVFPLDNVCSFKKCKRV